jgi:Pentapeptide repeats (8 copies)
MIDFQTLPNVNYSRTNQKGINSSVHAAPIMNAKAESTTSVQDHLLSIRRQISQSILERLKRGQHEGDVPKGAEVEGAEVLTSYTRWLESVQLKEGENQEVYIAFSPRFERIWLESRKRLPEYIEQKPANRYGASTLCASTVGQRSTSKTEPRPFHWRSSGECSVWNQSRTRREMSFAKRRCPSGRTSSNGRLMSRLRRLAKTDFRGAKLSGAKLSGANLHRADLDLAVLSEADLNGAVLSWGRPQRGEPPRGETQWDGP